MRSAIGNLGVAGLIALAAVNGHGQALLKPKNIGSSILTKPTTPPSGVAERKNVGSVVAGKAPIIEIALPEGSSEAVDINDSGTVLVLGIEKKTCFVWTQAGGFVPVEPKGDAFSLEGDGSVIGVIGKAINGKGQVAGGLALSDGRTLAFVWDPETGMRLLGTLGGPCSIANDLNDDGLVVGASMTARANKGSDSPTLLDRSYFKTGCAFGWSASSGMIPIGRFGTPQSTATGVNGKGVAVGWFGSSTVGADKIQSFLWTQADGAEVIHGEYLFDSLDRVGSFAALATAIRDDNTVLMFYHGFLSPGDRIPEARGSMGLVAGGRSARYWFKADTKEFLYKIMPRAINASSIAVGHHQYAKSSTGPQTAIAWRPDAKLADLNDFAQPGWNLTDARAINSKDQIVGIGVKDGKTRGFLMNFSTSFLPTPMSSAITRLNDNARLTKPAVIKPPKLVKPPQ